MGGSVDTPFADTFSVRITSTAFRMCLSILSAVRSSKAAPSSSSSTAAAEVDSCCHETTALSARLNHGGMARQLSLARQVGHDFRKGPFRSSCLNSVLRGTRSAKSRAILEEKG